MPIEGKIAGTERFKTVCADVPFEAFYAAFSSCVERAQNVTSTTAGRTNRLTVFITWTS